MTTTLAVFAIVVFVGACTVKSAPSQAGTPSSSGSAGAVGAILYELPKARTSDSLPSAQLGVTLTQDGRAFVNDVPLPNDEAISDRVRGERGKFPRLVAIIQADRAVPYGRVIHIMDLLRQGGIEEVAFAVQTSAPVPATVSPASPMPVAPAPIPIPPGP